MSVSRVTLVRAYTPVVGGVRIEYNGDSQILNPTHVTRFTLPYAGTFKSWQLKGDNVGSLNVSVWASAINLVPVVGDNIAGVTPPSLTNEQQRSDIILPGWTPTFVANTNFLITIVSCSNTRWAELILNLERT